MRSAPHAKQAQAATASYASAGENRKISSSDQQKQTKIR
jgi:hypothetical protein